MSGSLREKLSSYNSEVPLERAHTIPSLWYLDPEIYDLERRAVFGRTWQWAGRENEVSESSSYLTIDIAGEPVAMVRDKDGVLRAFSNVCRHRAARVLTSPCGKANFLQCRYHGWTYDQAGRLKGTPEFDGVEDFFREENALPAWRISAWNGFLFINSQVNTVSLPEFLYPLPDRVQAHGHSTLKFHKRLEYTIECNWKVFIDNYLDGGYHVNILHPKLAGVLNFQQYHTQIARNSVVQISPMKASANAEVNRVRQGKQAQYWWIYPNLMLNFYEGMYDINVVRPLGANRCQVIFEFFFSDELINNESFVKESIEMSHQVQLEDVGICEEVQRNLGSRLYDTGRFSVKREGGGHHFHQMLARELQHAAGLPTT